MERASSGKRIQLWLGIFISLICIIAILAIIKPGDIWDVIRQARVEFLLLAFLGLIGFLILRAIRWRFMLNGGWTSRDGIAYLQVFHIQNVGYLVTNILPFRLGDVARAVLVGSVPPITVGQGLSTVIVERVLDMLFIVVLFPFTIATAVDLPREWQTAVLLAGILSAVAAAIFITAANMPSLSIRVVTWFCDRTRFLDSKKWVERVGNLLQGLDTLTRWKDAITLLFLSILVWIPLILGYYAGIKAVNLEVSVSEAAFVVCIAAFSLAAPSSPGGLGVQEAAIAFAMSGILKLPDGESVGFALIYRTLYYILTGVLGIIGINRLGENFGSIVASTRSLVGSGGDQQIETVSSNHENK
jgi:uncharacterized protein (TIRG00374 family)